MDRTRSGWIAAVAAVATRPRLWAPAVRMLRRMAARGWWRSAPFVPRPDPAYLEFRLTTAFGPDPGPPPAREVVAYLEWLKAWPEVARR
jgi:hypothetical protein